MRNLVFLLPDHTDAAALNHKILQNFSVVSEPQYQANRTYYDTFDWRFYSKKRYVVAEGNSVQLRSLDNDRLIAEARVRNKKLPTFYWQFPQTQLQHELARHQDVRALIPQVQVAAKGESLRILNRDEKTVLRVQFEQMELAGPAAKASLALISLLPVRGYFEEQENFAAFLLQAGLTPAPQRLPELIFRQVGLEPGACTSKVKLQLNAGEQTGEAVRQILDALRETILDNEQGVIDDIDTEFLHDFRVAVRRTRSALSQIKGVLPSEETERFRHDFRAIGKATNRLRDLDVYLLRKSEYEQMLPPDFQPELAALFKSLQQARKREHRKVAAFLESDEFRQVMRDWQHFLSELASKGYAGKAGKPVEEVAARAIRKRYEKVLTAGRAIRDNSPDESLHSLRIACKKLRYMLEFFASLYPQDKITALIKHLKKLQDNLGDFNDLSVQQQDLRASLARFKRSKDDSTGLQIALGGLIAVLYQKQLQVRRAFARTFAAFDSDGNRELFESLF